MPGSLVVTDYEDGKAIEVSQYSNTTDGHSDAANDDVDHGKSKVHDRLKEIPDFENIKV